ncbi:SDR family NAD(P)-dependent oxidoreductase, partial [Escherichia coli]|uniref:SDR family NAD(P)-dependent oxidoreductase n=1 Tax=Escherichia coli TaxID=562 RepID=UPI003F461959
LDVLVNLAGIDLEAKAEEFAEDDWRKVIEINLSGAFWLSQTAGRKMIEAGRGGRIIQFSSTRSVAGGRRGFAAYSASKAGVN